MAKKSQTGPATGRYRVGVYPGTFDPITNGHLDIISRAIKVVDKLVVGIAVNVGKGPMFSLKDRVAMCRKEVAAMKLNGNAGGRRSVRQSANGFRHQSGRRSHHPRLARGFRL